MYSLDRPRYFLSHCSVQISNVYFSCILLHPKGYEGRYRAFASTGKFSVVAHKVNVLWLGGVVVTASDL